MLNRIKDKIANIDFHNVLGTISMGVVLVAFIVLFGFIIAAGAENESEHIISDRNAHIFVDSETGVNYILYKGVRETSITVRYNADGTIYISEKENN